MKKKKINKQDWIEYDYHLPVFRDESVGYLFNPIFENIKETIYIDGTLGGGGHTAIIMQKLNLGGKLFAFDKDITAINKATKKFEEEIKSPSPRIVLYNESFSKAYNICEEQGVRPNGILLDLGVSSRQLDDKDSGFSYRFNSPLDMRFEFGGSQNDSANNITAKDIINCMPEQDLANIIHTYGEEPKSRVIARRITEVRRARTLETTWDLRKIIEDIIPKQYHFKTLSRVFQAIRIEVNQELTELTNTLNNIINIMTIGGRIVVISYHSLEDRIVKQLFKENSYLPSINKYAPIFNEQHTNNDAIIMPKLKLLTKNPKIPSDEEIKGNPRARSAKMRVAEKIQ